MFGIVAWLAKHAKCKNVSEHPPLWEQAEFETLRNTTIGPCVPWRELDDKV
jgi:hypothetical protein